MNLLHDAYTALLAGLTHKIGNEIHWQDKWDNPITVEPIDINNDKYIVRYYYENGNREWEGEYQDDKRHGKAIWWYENGNREWETEYQAGLPHGKAIGWDENGNKEYQDGELIK